MEKELTKDEIKKLIQNDKFNDSKAKAREGVKYYKGKHDILNHVLFYYNSDGEPVIDRYRSNIKIPHQFHTELVDQKVQYLLSNPMEYYTEDERLQNYLEEYLNEDFQVKLQELLEGASNKGSEYIYAYINKEDKLDFQVADSLKIIEKTDDYGNLEHIIRYYKLNKKLTRVEVWDKENVTYYILKNNELNLDKTINPNPRPHILKNDGENFLNGGSFDRIPFFRLDNNKYRQTDLEPIKKIIDDYDLMSASLSNNLEDFQDAIYVVKNYQGDSLDALTQNLKTRKTIGVAEDGGLDVKTIDIPYEARKIKLDLNKENIYKFGMGFDSSQLGDGNITNVVIKSRYSLLDLKCNKAEIRLKELIRELLDLIVADINRRYRTSFSADEVEFSFTRSTMVDENDLYKNNQLEEETKTTKLNNIMLASQRLSEETTLRLICEVLELDFEEEKGILEVEDKKDSAFDLDRLNFNFGEIKEDDDLEDDSDV